MAWKFNNESPIYLQIVEIIKTQIAQGVLKPGDQVPAVRELAVTAGVNPNTMQKALAELEREGVLYSQRTAGRFVADRVAGGGSLREELVKSIYRPMWIICGALDMRTAKYVQRLKHS